MNAFIRNVISLLVILALFYGALQYVFPAPCSQVIKYSIGTIDKRFSLSGEEFLSSIQKAEAAWEKPFGKDLFTYDSTASFTMNLVYDERQEHTDQVRVASQTLSETSKTRESIKQQYDRAYRTYIQAQKTYEESVNAYEADAQKLARDVEKTNESGGASPDEYKNLQARQKELLAQKNALEQEQTRLNSLAEKVNSLADSENKIVKTYNAKVEEINEELGEDREFRQGEYNGKSITIYEFTNEKDLVLVLEHEMGHALGLEHSQSPSSVMYYLGHERDTNEKGPTKEDLVALSAQCKKTSLTVFLELLWKMKYNKRNVIF